MLSIIIQGICPYDGFMLLYSKSDIYHLDGSSVGYIGIFCNDDIFSVPIKQQIPVHSVNIILVSYSLDYKRQLKYALSIKYEHVPLGRSELFVNDAYGPPYYGGLQNY